MRQQKNPWEISRLQQEVGNMIKKSAFTLIELLIVVAIIGILAAIAVPNFMVARVRAKVARSLEEQRVYRHVQQMYMLDVGDLPGHYDGKEEHCPYINLGYISSPLRDPFMEHKEDHPGFKYQEGMYHSTHITTEWSVDVKALNVPLYDQWVGAGKPYVIYGEGPGICGAWVAYDTSNGLQSCGIIIGIGIRGKGIPDSGLAGRSCN
jgi:prepilin-type N-terminal cleavage/methylation domain-containing protein